MSYWRKKQGLKSIRCCGKTSKGQRCKKEFYSDDGITTCHLHREQKDATVWYDSEIGQFKDVCVIIAKYIDEPITFYRFSQVCRSAAKACHQLQKEKMTMWRKLVMYNPSFGELTKRYILPNGSTIDKNNKYIQRCGSATGKLPYLKYGEARKIFIIVNGKRRQIFD